MNLKSTLVGVALTGVTLGFSVGYLTTELQLPLSSVQEMRLETYIGDVSLTNLSEVKQVSEGVTLEHKDDLKTQASSGASLLLDERKVLQVDENSNIGLEKVDDQLDVHLHSGSVFFHVTQPLTDTERLAFHTGNVGTNVHDTSGIISYHREDKVTQIAVFTGTVVTTTADGEKTVSAGEIAIVTTQEDGTETFELLTAEPNVKPYLSFNDDFINNLQGELNNKGDSLLYTEALRRSNVPSTITLPDSIQVLGNARTFSLEQAEAFANIIESRAVFPKFILFFDGGNGIPVMVLGEEHNYFYGGHSYVESVNAFLYQWNGTSAQLLHPDGLDGDIPHYICQKEDQFFVNFGTDHRQFQGADTISTVFYSFEDGVRNQLPVAILVSMWSNYPSFSSVDWELNWTLASPVTSIAQYTSHKNSTGQEWGSSYWYNGTWTYTDDLSFYYHNPLLEHIGENVVNYSDIESPYWNKAQDVLNSLKQP